MSVVIVGAGTVGCHIAETLAGHERNVILVEPDRQRIERMSQSMDVAIRVGDGTDWQVLDDLVEQSPTHLLALTFNDQVNLVACSIAKQLGYPVTVARVKQPSYFNPTRLDFGRIFSVDHFVGPEWLAAQDIARSIMSPGTIYSESFANGVVQLKTIKVPDSWRRGDVPLMDLKLPRGLMLGLIRRSEGKQHQVIFPHGTDVLRPGDEATFIGEADEVYRVHEFLGQTRRSIDSVTIVGGTLTGVQLARALVAQGVSVRLIDKDYDVCTRLSQELSQVTIVHHDATDVDFLRAERIGHGQAFVACTSWDESNLLVAALANDLGCDKVIALVSDLRYRRLYERLEVSQVLSPRMLAADRILSIVGSGSVSSMVSLYENQAEILEIKISPESRFVGIALAELGPRLPRDFLIAVIQNRGRVMVANGSRVLSPGDTIVVLTHPRHIDEFQYIF